MFCAQHQFFLQRKFFWHDARFSHDPHACGGRRLRARSVGRRFTLAPQAAQIASGAGLGDLLFNEGAKATHKRSLPQFSQPRERLVQLGLFLFSQGEIGAGFGHHLCRR